MKGNSECQVFIPCQHECWSYWGQLSWDLMRYENLMGCTKNAWRSLSFQTQPKTVQWSWYICVWLPSSNCKRHNLRWAADGVKWTAQGISPWKFPSKQFRAWNVKYAPLEISEQKRTLPGFFVWNAARSNCWWSCEAPSCGAPDKAQVRRSTARNTAASFGWAEAKAPRTGSDSMEINGVAGAYSPYRYPNQKSFKDVQSIHL